MDYSLFFIMLYINTKILEANLNPEDIENNSYAQQLENAVLKTLEDQQKTEKSAQTASELFIFPLVRRPFFPGMAAPVVIEPGPFLKP